jgi:hypothetical protein
MSAFSVDVEADGPCPGLYSMVSFGAVLIADGLEHTFYSGIIRPISEDYIPDALAVSGATREQQIAGEGAVTVMHRFRLWIEEHSDGRPILYSDNNGFDWQFINYYFHAFQMNGRLAPNPFGFSSQNIGSLYKGFVKDSRKNFKHLRKTKHTHHPVDDAKGNAEALLAMQRMGYRIKYK